MHLTVRMAASGILALTVGTSLVVGWPVNAVRTHVGMPVAIDDLCEMVPQNSVLLFDDQTHAYLPGVTRTECDLPFASLEEPNIVEKVRTAGLVPVSVTASMCGGNIGAIAEPFESPERTLTRTPSGPEKGWLLASMSVPDLPAEVETAPVPKSADASMQVAVTTKWRPSFGSSVIAAMDQYQSGMWLEYQNTGNVELWVASSEGHTGILVTPTVDDGIERSLGGYLDDGVLYATCGGQVVGSVSVPGVTSFDKTVVVNPVGDGDFGNREFDGQIRALSVTPPDTTAAVDVGHN
jgi:hypothetical protein